MTKLRIRTVQKEERRAGTLQGNQARSGGYAPLAARSNPHYDRWPSLPHLPRASR